MLLLPSLMLLLLAAPPPDNQGIAGVDGKAVRADLKNGERNIDDRVQQATSRAPFALLGQTRGAYLPGYGVVFSLEVNLVPVAGVSPFRPAYSRPEIQNLNQQKRAKLAELRTQLRQVLVDQGAALTRIPPTEKVAIVVTLFNFTWEDTNGLPSQIVLQATRQSLAELHVRKAAPDAIAAAIEMKEF
jgi:hypothetical protein